MSKESTFEQVMQAEDPSARQPLTVRLREAAAMLSMSIDSFQRHVRPEIRTIRVGDMVLVPVAELQRWIERNAVCVGGDWQ